MNNDNLLVVRMLLLDKVLSNEKKKILLRVVSIDHFSSTVCLCRIDDHSWPFRISRSDLDAQMDPEHGRYTIEPHDPYGSFKVGELNAKTAALHERRYELIKPLISGENESLMLSKSSRKTLIRLRMKEMNCSYDTIVDLIRLYWKRGMTYQALRPDYHKCGRIKDPDKVRSVKNKLGAPRKYKTGKGINIVGDYVTKAIKQGAELWSRNKKFSLKDAYDWMVRLFFSKAIKDDHGRITDYEIDEDNKPTLRQLQYHRDKLFTYGRKRRQRHGQRNWDKNERPITGRADGDVQGPGDRFQVDATIADVYLVSSKDRKRIVGRPVIYFVKDVFSRLITGIYVGFEGPSWIGAMMVLVNMVMDKVAFCHEYGIDIGEDEWPCQEAPRRLMGDRAELMSVDLGENIVKNLKIDIENASPGRADLKGVIERTFGTVPLKFRPFVPGYVEKDFNERGAEDYRLKATLNLYEFTQLVILAVLEHNEETIRGLEIPTEMVTEGLTACPLDLWKWGVRNRSGSLKRLDLDYVRLNVMPRGTARITAKGIHFQKGYYTCSAAVREEWFAKARKETWTVEVSYDPRNLGILYILDPQMEKGYEVCRLLECSSDLLGVSLFEEEEVDICKKGTEVQKEDDNQARRLVRDKQSEDIVKNATKATRAALDPNMSNTERTADVRYNRDDEKQFQRQKEKFDLSGKTIDEEQSVRDANPAAGADDYVDRELAALEAKRQKREGTQR